MNEAARSQLMDEFVGTLAPLHLYPLWRQQGLLIRKPTTRAIPYLWPYAPIRERLLRAGELITAEEAERRVLILRNPGLEGKPAATARLYAGMQLVLPHEIAPAHYHSASAIRFVVEGAGAYTAVDGERAIMAPGDLVLTAAWAVHDHGNETDVPMIWLDGLDLPLVNGLECSFFSEIETRTQKLTLPDDVSERTYAQGAMRPDWVAWSKNHSPLMKYPWTATERILLDAWKDGAAGTPADAIRFEYTNPITGGPVLPTMSCFAQLLPPQSHTAAHRHTASAVYHVVRGGGTTIIDGEPIHWQEKDTFALPGWAVHEHINSCTEPALLFSFTDDPTLRALGFYHERSEQRQG
ncbi:MAG TPA: cupin domain-containing protein [bacterium]|nr:cupin domain-containing protein [bacterium]